MSFRLSFRRPVFRRSVRSLRPAWAAHRLPTAPVLAAVSVLTVATACTGGRAPTEPAGIAPVAGTATGAAPVFDVSRDSTGARMRADSVGRTGGTGTGTGRGQTPIWW